MIDTILKPARIKLLDESLASQIAAGEVIERPASVLKELLENSIDAGAKQIDVAIQRGGIQMISVRDNGSGIEQADLGLALQQHATSKIHNIQDLANIASLGFRGEALASINSVAKLTITSRTNNSDAAWSIQGSEISPAAHPIGTTMLMRDLFYNVPARRKFLRSERTEYIYLEEVFRRIALSNFEVGFSLKNQDKLVKNLLPCKDLTAQTRRVEALCGQQVLQKALHIDIEQNGLRLYGWLGLPSAARSQENHQYFFINQRVIRDRLINHAIREVYSTLCLPGKMPFYCLYLELDPIALDVNVHPTKHEVRFRDARIIHEFLTQALRSSLQYESLATDIPEDNVKSDLQSALPYKYNKGDIYNSSLSNIIPNLSWHLNHASSTQTQTNFTQNTKINIVAILSQEVLLARDSKGLLLINITATMQKLNLNNHNFQDVVTLILEKYTEIPENLTWKYLEPQQLLRLITD